jgi:nucleolar GTP-binding protein
MYTKMPSIKTEKELLDKAFNQARKAAESVHVQDKRLAFRIRDLRRLEKTRDVITNYFQKILDNTPHFDNLNDFYKDLIKTQITVEDFKKSLASLKWAKEQIEKFTEQYKTSLKGAQMNDLSRIRNAYYGRVSSIIKQIKKNLKFLEECRKILIKLPVIKDKKTFIITGYPNVGKSSLLNKLTGANPQIQPYPFTTKNLMIGYIDDLVQLIDTPGILDREKSKTNTIETRAILALKHLSNEIVYIFDPSETCGYTIEQQIKLLKNIKKDFDCKITIVINKTDIIHKTENIKKIEKLEKKIFKTSSLKNEGIKELRKYLLKDVYPGKEKFYKK